MTFSHTRTVRRNLACSMLLGASLILGFPNKLHANSCPLDVGGAHSYYGGYYNAPELPNPSVFVSLQEDGTIVSWGEATNGGENEPTDSGYVSVSSNWFAFAALKEDGSITAWGVSSAGGDGEPEGTGFNAISSNVRAFAALHNDGSIRSWGDLRYGGGNNPAGNNYVSITANVAAFAALTDTGGIRTWGQAISGVLGTPTDDGYVAIAANESAFAALKEDGTITSWGNNETGGLGAPTKAGYLRLYSGKTAFAALHEDGSVASWGDEENGGAGAPVEGVFSAIASTDTAFAALDAEGRLHAWGADIDGGMVSPSVSGYVSIIGNQRAFAALHADGSIESWGDPASGGAGAPTATEFVYITANHGHFAALTNDGVIYTWGGGDSAATVGDSDSRYVDIATTGLAFAALDANGSVYTWGLLDSGGVGGPEDSETVSISGRSVQPAYGSCVPGRNRAPSIDGAPVLNANAFAYYEFTTTAFDPDGGELRFSLSNNPQWLSVDAGTGVVSGTPSDEDLGAAVAIVVSVTDAGGKQASLPPFDLLIGQMSEEQLIASILQSGERLVEQLIASGLSNVVAERSTDYDAALNEAPVAPATLVELQLLVDTTNARLNAIEQAVVDLALIPTDNAVLLERLKSALVVSVVDENANAYRAALNRADSQGLTRQQLQAIVDEVNAIESLIKVAISIKSGEQPLALLADVLVPFRELAPSLHSEFADSLVGLDASPANVEAVNALITGITERAEFQPVVSLAIEQSGITVNSINVSAGLVTVRASIDNLNEDQMISYDWSASSNELLGATLNADTADNMLVFDPADFSASGRLVARITAINKGFQSSSKIAIVVRQGEGTAEELSDQDNDGVADRFEGSLGASGTSSSTQNKLQGQAGQDAAYVMETDEGLFLRMGTDSRIANTQQGGLSYDEFLLQRPESTIDLEAFVPPDNVYDFEIAGLPRVGVSAFIVIPHQAQFPVGASYENFHPATGWSKFVVDDNNSISSSPPVNGVLGQCPEPQNASYRPGINVGDACLQLRIQDGGPNDGDRLTESGAPSIDQGINGNIEDPGALLFPIDEIVDPSGANPSLIPAAANPDNIAITRVGGTGLGGSAPLGLLLLGFGLSIRRVVIAISA